jgi:hypothetical protein
VSGLSDDQISEYFVDLGMAEGLVGRGILAVRTTSDFISEPAEHVFVSEYRDEEGNRNYESLWVLTERYISESPGFVSEQRFDAVPVKHGLARIDLSRESFDFAEATEQSRLTVDITLARSGGVGITGTFKASGDNCTRLSEIVRGYLLPLLQRD